VISMGETYVEGGVDVDVELGLAAAEGGEHAEGDQLPVAGGEFGARVHFAEGPGDDLATEFR
jgi:hypothetical protein